MTLLQRLRTCHSRVRVIGFALSMMLFQQMALAAYICPLGEASSPAQMTEIELPACEDMGMSVPDPQAPALCHQDCQGDHAVRAEVHAPQAVAPIVLPLYFVPDVHLAPQAGPHPANVSATPADPPPSLRFCRLLI
jgi:hypothetical protein